MTANRRIFLNIVVTYGCSLYALVIGLFTARWVLMALGEVDFGLYGVVGVVGVVCVSALVWYAIVFGIMCLLEQNRFERGV